MKQVTIKQLTHVCERGLPTCGYKYSTKHDISQPGFMARKFRLPGLPDGACPACFTGRNRSHVALVSKMEETTDEALMVTRRTASDEELGSRMVDEYDRDGQPVMVETGEVRYRLNQRTGQIEEYPVLEQRQRQVTEAEYQDSITRRDQTLDGLESRAVKEVDEER